MTHEIEMFCATERSRVESLITSESKKRAFSIAYEKESSSWLSALPLRSPKVFFGDSGDAGILASRFLIKILKSSETQN